MPNDLHALETNKTILLTTFKRDGTGVATPVSIAFDGQRAFFRTWHNAGKVKRLANNPQAAVIPCTLFGTPNGPKVDARARLLSKDEAPLAAAALARRHPVLQAVLVPVAHRLMRYRTLHYELFVAEYTPCSAPSIASSAVGSVRAPRE